MMSLTFLFILLHFIVRLLKSIQIRHFCIDPKIRCHCRKSHELRHPRPTSKHSSGDVLSLNQYPEQGIHHFLMYPLEVFPKDISAI